MKLNKIYNEDCLGDKELETGMWRIPDKSVDMILCDLPYGTTRNKWDSIIPLDKLWNHYNRIIKDNGAIVLTAQTPFDKVLGCSNLKMLKYEWIWNKQIGTGFLNAKKMPLKSHENILVFYKKPPTYNPQMTEADLSKNKPQKEDKQKSTNYGSVDTVKYSKDYDNTKRYPLTILSYNKSAGELNSVNRIHPTQKPVELFDYLIKTYTNEGEIVLDSCMGSGTTAIACINANRNYIGFELEEEYYIKANKRIELHSSELKTK